MKFFIKEFFSKCNQVPADLLTFTEECLNGKLHFLCSAGINDGILSHIVLIKLNSRIPSGGNSSGG